MSGLTQRDTTLDTVRGLIMCLMALDHVRIFFSSAQFDPTDIAATTPGYFFMRWITHLCAPGFFFIAGLSIAFIEHRSSTKRDVSVFLALRGLWLIALELFVFGFAWSFNYNWRWLGVIWGLGSAMLVMSLLIYLPRLALLCAALLFTALHNNLWPLFTSALGTNDTLIYNAGVVEWPLLGKMLVIYPLLPWLALMALGYATQAWLISNQRVIPKRFLGAGLALILAFMLCRGVGFGQPDYGPVDETQVGVRYLLSFFNIEKYPPSLQFSLITLGVLAICTWFFDRFKAQRIFTRLSVFGQVPFFFYLLHLFIIHGAALLCAKVLSWPQDYLFWQRLGPNLTPPDGYGFGLLGIYVVWMMVLLMLFPLCQRFAQQKQQSSAKWLRFL
jgi:uncharacterized membrane protein